MYILNQLQFEKKKTTYSSIKDCYGIGHKTSKKLNSILLNKPNAREFKYDLNKLVRSKEGKSIFSLPSEISLRSKEFNNILHLAEIKTYRAFRQFQNLPSRGQRTHTNSQTSKKQVYPMLRLKINKDIAEGYYVKFKKLEFLRNGRSEEYNSFVKNQNTKKKFSKKKYSQKDKDLRKKKNLEKKKKKKKK
jgi:ribosomal protein S13